MYVEAISKAIKDAYHALLLPILNIFLLTIAARTAFGDSAGDMFGSAFAKAVLHAKNAMLFLYDISESFGGKKADHMLSDIKVTDILGPLAGSIVAITTWSLVVFVVICVTLNFVVLSTSNLLAAFFGYVQSVEKIRSLESCLCMRFAKLPLAPGWVSRAAAPPSDLVESSNLVKFIRLSFPAPVLHPPLTVKQLHKIVTVWIGLNCKEFPSPERMEMVESIKINMELVSYLRLYGILSILYLLYGIVFIGVLKIKYFTVIIFILSWIISHHLLIRRSYRLIIFDFNTYYYNKIILQAAGGGTKSIAPS